MANVAVQTFNDPYEYQAFTCDAQHRVIVTGRGQYQAKTIRLNLPRVTVRRAWQSLPSISHLTIPEGRTAICFPLDTHEEPAIWGGGELQSGQVFLVHSGGNFYNRTDRDGRWASVSLAASTIAGYMQALTGDDFNCAGLTHVRPRVEAISRLQAVHQAAGHLAESAPDVIAQPKVAEAIEQELMRAVIACMTDPAEPNTRRMQRLPVMRRFEEFLEANPGCPLHILDVCSAIGVSERTLRAHSMVHLGISPHRYLWLRRMHQVRRALAVADARAKTVTQMAIDHGFWELGRPLLPHTIW